jgi:hypothetical protein
MSNTKNISDRLFITPIDDRYEDQKDSENLTDESFGTIEGIISGLNVLMQCSETKGASPMSNHPTQYSENLSTKSCSPYDTGVIFLKNDKSDNSLHENRKINIRGKRVKLTQFLKKSWKIKLENSKETSLRKLLSKSKDTLLPFQHQPMQLSKVSCFTGKFIPNLNFFKNYF